MQSEARALTWEVTRVVAATIPPAVLTVIALTGVAMAASAEEPTMLMLIGEVVFTGKVVAVLDGDTIEVRYHDKKAKVRIASIDAPEKNQPSGKAARKFLKELVLGEMVTVYATRFDWTGGQRNVGRVVMETKCVGRELVRAGFAWYCARHVEQPPLAAAEAEAKAGSKGLWQERDPIPPREFRGVENCYDDD